MSRSFMDSIRSVVTEGAKEKTADGMTKDAKHFRADLHTIKDSGMKHLVQKDSETKDYEKMFNGNVDRAKARLSDQQAPEDLNKYVEYNEEAELEEAKAKEEKHDEDCECEDCSSDVNEEIVNEAGPMKPGSTTPWQTAKKPGPQAAASVSTSRSTSAQPTLATRVAQNLGMPSSASQIKPSGMSGNYPRSAQNTTTMPQQTKSTGSQAVARIKATKAAAGQQARMGGNPTGAPNAPTDRNLTKDQAITKGREAKKKAEVRSAVQTLKSPMVGQGTSGADATAVMKKPEMSPTLKAQRRGSIGGRYDIAPNKKPLAKPTNQPYGMNIPKKSPTLQAQMDGQLADKRPPSQQPGSQLPAASPGPSFEKKGRGGSPSLAPPPKPKLKFADAPAQKQKQKPAAPAQPSVSAAKRREARRKLEKGAVGPEAKKFQRDSGLGATTGKVVRQRPSAPQPRGKAARDAVGPGTMNSSFEIEINGTSYLVSEAHASAIAAFVEKYGEVNEVLTKSTTAGETISDFVHSKNPKFKGDTKNKRIQRALAAYYAKQRE